MVKMLAFAPQHHKRRLPEIAHAHACNSLQINNLP
jgi:hypothetical protein